MGLTLLSVSGCSATSSKKSTSMLVPPIPPVLPTPHLQPHSVLPRPNIPDDIKERIKITRIRIEKEKADVTGILYPYEIENTITGFNYHFDIPADWSGYIIQKRGNSDDTWFEFKSQMKNSMIITLASDGKAQYRLIRTISQ